MRALSLLLLLLTLALQTALELESGWTPLETGWSNGNTPEGTKLKVVPFSLCPAGAFIESWVTGEAGPEAHVRWLSVVYVKGICTDGTALPGVEGFTPATVNYDYRSNSDLKSTDGYSCARLLEGSYSNGQDFMMSFMGIGQKLRDNPVGKPFKLACNCIPWLHVAVGYSGSPGRAVDGLDFQVTQPHC